MFSRCFLLVFLLGAVFPELLLAETTIQITDSGSDSWNVDVSSHVSDPDQALSLVWIDDRDGTADIYFSRVSPDGLILVDQLQVSDSGSEPHDPGCSVDATGTTTIGWLEDGNFMMARVSAGGAILTPPAILVSGPVEFPKLDVDYNGTIQAVWVEATLSRRVKYRSFSPVGNPLGSCPEGLLDSTSGLDDEHPFVLAKGGPSDQYVYFSWHGNLPYGSSPPTGHYFNINITYPVCKVYISGPFQQTNDIALTRSVMVRRIGETNVYAVFEGPRESAGSQSAVYWLQDAQVYSPLDAEIGSSTHADIASRANSEVLVVWETETAPGLSAIYAQAVNGPTAERIGPNQLITPVAGHARRPAVARVGATDRFGVAWDQAEVVGRDIYLSIRDLAMQSTVGSVTTNVRSISTGEGLASAHINLTRNQSTYSASTNPQGVAQLANVMPGEYVAQATYLGRQSEARTVMVTAPGDAVVDLWVPTSFPLVGSVVDDFNGLPVAGATVAVLDGDGWPLVDVPTTDLGRFAFDLLLAGTYSVRVSKTGVVGTSQSSSALYKEKSVDVTVSKNTPPIEIRVETNTVVLLHGIRSRAAMWQGSGGMADALRGSGWAVVDNIDLPGCVNDAEDRWCGLESVAEQAEWLQSESRKLPVHSFHVVAHSQGGLVARWYNEVLPEEWVRIDKLITLGTPHHGSQLATSAVGIVEILSWPLITALGAQDVVRQWWKDFDPEYPALGGLQPNSASICDLNQMGGTDWAGTHLSSQSANCRAEPNVEQRIQAVTTYVTLSGSKWGSYWLGGMFLLKDWCESSDGIVPGNSSRLWASGDKICNRLDSEISAETYHGGFAGDETIQTWVAGVLSGDQLLGNASFGGLQAADLSPESPWGLIGEASMVVHPGNTWVDSLLVEVTDTLVVVWSWGGPQPEVSLITPTGVAVDSSTAAVDSSVVYSVFPENGLAEYRVAVPAPGFWKLQTVNASGQDTLQIVVAALASGAATAMLSLEPVSADQFADRLATLSVSADGSPVLGASALLSITDPSLSNRAVALADDGIYPDAAVGDGVYSGLVSLEWALGVTEVAYHVWQGDPVSFERAGAAVVIVAAETDVRIGALGLQVASTTNSVGGEISLSATVENAGAEWTEVRAEIVEGTTGLMVFEDTLSLGPSSSAYMSATLLPLDAREYTFAAHVVPIGGMAESDWSNNSATAALQVNPVTVGVPPDQPGQEDEPEDGRRGPVAILGVFPNPLTSSAKINWTLSHEEEVTVVVYDLLGRLVQELHSGKSPAGSHWLEWDGRDESGRPVASGIFFIRVATREAEDVRKVVLLR